MLSKPASALSGWLALACCFVLCLGDFFPVEEKKRVEIQLIRERDEFAPNQLLCIQLKTSTEKLCNCTFIYSL